MRATAIVALVAAACAAEAEPPAARVADVEIVVAPPPEIGCLELTLEDHRGARARRALPLPPSGRVRLAALPVGAYQVGARAYADCAAPPDAAPWETAAPAALIVDAGGATLRLELRRPTRLVTTTTLEIPWRGTFLASAHGDFLGDGSTVIVFGGPSWEDERTPFRAVRVARDGALADVTATLLPDAPAAVHARRALAVELNGDGRLDFFSANHGWDFPPFPGETQTLLLSRPDGTLADASATLPQAPLFAHSAAAADLRGIGRADIIVGQIGARAGVGPYLLRNDGGGAFTAVTATLPPEIAFPTPGGAAPGMFTACLLVDVNGDAAPDLVVASLEDSDRAGAVFLNDGAGDFSASPRLPFPEGTFGPKNSISVDLLATDLDRDGDADLLVSQTAATPFYAGRRVQVLVNDGAGIFTDETAARIPGQSGAGNWIQFLYRVDLDFDGVEDLLLQVDHPHDGDVLAYLDDGSGHFTPAPPELLPPGARRSLVPVDLNHDGRTDLVSFAPRGGVLTVTAFRR
jgi:hypothetical protein